jgi:hypothetical protein
MKTTWNDYYRNEMGYRRMMMQGYHCRQKWMDSTEGRMVYGMNMSVEIWKHIHTGTHSLYVTTRISTAMETW